jgi:hypothetical protein
MKPGAPAKRRGRIASILGAAAAIALAVAVLGMTKDRWLRAFYGPGKTTTVSGITADGRSVRVTLTTGRADGVWLRKASGVTSLWGAEDDRPEDLLDHDRVVWDLTVEVGGRPWSVPEEAYLDLVDLRLRGVKQANRSGETVVRFDGSDAFASYHGFFALEAAGVLRREVWHGEFPESGRELSRYAPGTGLTSKAWIRAPAEEP